MNPDTIDRPLRADALRNKRRIIDAAREMFATRGIDITLDDVAAHAGVGVGTVYRRFANKQELIDGVFEQRLQDMVERADLAVAEPDPWKALVDFFGYLCKRMSRDRGLTDIVLGVDSGRLADVRELLDPKVEAIILRAKAGGALRSDIATSDFFALMFMISAGADFASSIDADNWRRYFTVVIDGLREHPGRTEVLPGRPFTTDEVHCAKVAMHEHRR